MNSPAQKYRPYFSYPELKRIHELVAISGDARDTVLLNYLHIFIYKIDAGIKDSALVLEPRKSLEERLELSLTLPESISSSTNFGALRFEAYKKFIENPVSLTPLELSRAHEYRYEQGIMNSEEEDQYLNLCLSGSENPN